jgi:hypothetical protein
MVDAFRTAEVVSTADGPQVLATVTGADARFLFRLHAIDGDLGSARG